MLVSLLWIISAYALCLLAVHVIHAWNRRGAKGPACRPIVIITHNHQHQVEWVLRSLLFCNWLRGKPIQLLVIDTGSTDLTVKIVSKLAKSSSLFWNVAQSEAELDQMLSQLDNSARVIDLNRQRYEAGWLVC